MFRYLILIILLSNGLTEKPSNRNIFISPLKIPLSLSANFGELRADHFHSGLDMRTQGVTGKEVVAAASGYVYRISVSPGGFGKALYIRHPSGFSTVYGHLENFVPEISEYVKQKQYERRSFAVTLFPEKEKFPVEQGELIAFSGNSGSSGGPHLHYEIRNSEIERPVNPLLFDFGVEDKIRPVFENLIVYPQRRGTVINNNLSGTEIRITGSDGKYKLPGNNEIKIYGPASFGLKAYDMINNSGYKFSVNSVELSVDSTVIFSYKMDGFSFSESRYINSHIDYGKYIQDKVYFERLFIQPNNRLKAYGIVINRGIYNFNDGASHTVKIMIRDIEGNSSILTFNVLPDSNVPFMSPDSTDSRLMIMPYNKNNKFITDNLIVDIPANALYDTCYFSYQEIIDSSLQFSNLHQVHDIFTPVHKPYRLSIKPKIIPEGKTSKLLIVQKTDEKNSKPVGGTFSKGFITTDLTGFGNFYIAIDTVPPVINTNGMPLKADLSGRKKINFRITDNLSGIKSYETYIDGKWALTEYDQKYDLLIYEFDPERIASGTDHTLTLRVADNKDNISTFKCNFRW